jgi:adenylosuccinate lyase
MGAKLALWALQVRRDIRQFTDMVLGLEVFPERMLDNLARSNGLVFSEAVLLALVESGLDRDSAYRITQKAAMEAWEERRPFREVLWDGDYVTAYLTEEQLDTCFNLRRALRNIGHMFDALEAELDEKIYL